MELSLCEVPSACVESESFKNVSDWTLGITLPCSLVYCCFIFDLITVFSLQKVLAG